MVEAPTEPEPLRRFYTTAAARPTVGGDAVVELDGRPVRTPARARLEAPLAVAEAIAAEWAAQGETVRPTTMPVTRLVNTAIDGVSRAVDAVREEIVKVAGTDLVAYRADDPEALVAAQRRHWDPIVTHTGDRLGVPLAVTSGIVPVAQPPELAAAVSGALPTAPLPLAGMHELTTLTGSALGALAFLHRAIDFDALWTAAHVDEDFNIAEWGEDAEAAARRAARRRNAEAAALVVRATA